MDNRLYGMPNENEGGDGDLIDHHYRPHGDRGSADARINADDFLGFLRSCHGLFLSHHEAQLTTGVTNVRDCVLSVVFVRVVIGIT